MPSRHSKYSRRVNYVNKDGLEFKLDNCTLGDTHYTQPTESELRADMWKWYREMQAAAPVIDIKGHHGMLPVERIELFVTIEMIEHERGI